MSNDLVVGIVIALMVVASVSYMIHQRRKRMRLLREERLIP